MARRSDHSKDEQRAMAIAAAIEIVNGEGWRALSARKVATRIGYTVGSLYLVFRNFDELIVHVNADTLDELLNVLKGSLSANRKPESSVVDLAHAYLTFAYENGARWEMVFEHRFQNTSVVPSWYQARVASLFAFVESVIQPMCANLPDDQIHITARSLWSGVHGITILSKTGKLDIADIESVDVLIGSLISNFLAGLKVRTREIEE
ncbi:MAG: TetR/AcrR family transcriptional regulator [Gammaproteobacteria bacterium]